MTPAEFAARLHGRTYRNEITRPESAEAKAAGLVVVYGYSDDNVELDGAVRDEISAYDGTTVFLGKDGEIHKPWDVLIEGELDESIFDAWFKRKASGVRSIEARWCHKDADGFAWSFVTDIPHATFDISDDGEPFCRGIVFALTDL